MLTLPSNGLIHLSTTLLMFTLRLFIEPEALKEYEVRRLRDHRQMLFKIVSPHKTTKFSLYYDNLLVDNIPIPIHELFPKNAFTISLMCDVDFALHINVTTPVDAKHLTRIIEAPKLCGKYIRNELLLGPDESWGEHFFGCIRNVTLGRQLVLDSWCRNSTTEKFSKTRPRNFVRSADAAAGGFESVLRNVKNLVQLGERLKVREGESVQIAFKNLLVFAGHQRLGVRNYGSVKFEVISQPEHGRLTFVRQRDRLTRFTYEDVIEERVEYHHDGSETTQDSFDFKVKIDVALFETDSMLKEKQLKIYSLPIQVEPVDDPPQLRVGAQGPLLNLAVGERVNLNEAHLRVWDADTPTHNVWVEVRRADGVLISDGNVFSLRRFSLAQLLNQKVFLASEGGNGEVEFSARDESNSAADTVTLRVTSVAVVISAGANSGIRLSHRASQLISANNLSFHSNFPEIALRYSIVDQPEFGLVECLRTEPEYEKNVVDEQNGRNEFEFYRLCSEFEQSDIDNSRVRYRHISENRPQADSFSFQVHCADVSTTIHVFHINFIAASFRVFMQESLLLNNTEQAIISTRNLLATAFPQNFPPGQLLYHIVEPPKYGMLSRKIDSSGGNTKFRRIGVSSNFTQQHVNENALVYKLHSVHYSIVNDFFSFRLVTPAVTSELLRFEIIYIPGPSSIQLVNRTLIVAEGATQQLTNATLWLETADDSSFLFTVAIAPFNGRLFLAGEMGAKRPLEIASTFSSLDISNKRLFYEHCGDETRWDRAYLVADSIFRKDSRIPFWLTISIVGQNDNPPRLARYKSFETEESVIHVVEESERVLHPSLLPWADADQLDYGREMTPASTWGDLQIYADQSAPLSFHFTELFRDFIICTREFPELSVRNFTQRQLDERALIVRHLNLKKNANKLRYTVSDGQHIVASTLKFVASKPFIRLSQNRTFISHSTAFNGSTFSAGYQVGAVEFLKQICKVLGLYSNHFLLITSDNLAASTNLDVDLEDIRFESMHGVSPFALFHVLQRDGTFAAADAFLQRDIFKRRIFLSLAFLANFNGAKTLTIPIRISAATVVATAKPLFSFFSFSSAEQKANQPRSLSADVAFSVEIGKMSNAIVLLQKSGYSAIQALTASSTVIDATAVGILALNGEGPNPNISNSDIKFFVTQAPRWGVLALAPQISQNLSKQNSFLYSTVSSNNFVLGFRQSDLISGRLYYLNFALSNYTASEDSFTVGISIPSSSKNLSGRSTVIGPCRFAIHLADSNQLSLNPSPKLSVKAGGKLPLTALNLRVSLPLNYVVDADGASVEYRIMRAPPAHQMARYGHLALRQRTNSFRPLHNAFTHAELVAGNVFFLASGVTLRNETVGDIVDNLEDESEESILEWGIRACMGSIRQAKCSAVAKLRISVDFDNKFGPEMVRNEILSVPTSVKMVILTSNYLRATDIDTSPKKLKYLIWRVIGGSLQFRKSQAENFVEFPAQSFSQADLDFGRVSFVFDQSADRWRVDVDEEKFGFQFLVSDGRHQTRANYFEIQRSDHPQILPNSTAFKPIVFSTPTNQDVESSNTDDKLSWGNVNLESNVKLNVSPGIISPISADSLKAIIDHRPPSDVVYTITRPPMHGRLILEGGAQKPVERFTQAQIDAGLLFYQSQADLGAWSQRDFFNFDVRHRNHSLASFLNSTTTDSKSAHDEFRFRILVSYSNIPLEELEKFVLRQKVLVGRGGSVMLNGSHLNLTKLSAFADDALFLRVARWPHRGIILRLTDEIAQYPRRFQRDDLTPTNDSDLADNENGKNEEESANGEELIHTQNNSSLAKIRMPLKAEEIEFGRDLLYRRYARQDDMDSASISDDSNEEDEIIFHVYPLREKYKRAIALKIPIRIHVLRPNDGVRIEKFPDKLDIVSGGRIIFSPEQFQITHGELDHSELHYRIFQPAQGGIRIFRSWSGQGPFTPEAESITQFTQLQLNRGEIGLEHFDPSLTDASNVGVVTLQIGESQTRVLPIRIEALALRLANHTEIHFLQGKTYVLLNRSHLGAESNGDRSRIIYNVTQAPVNGSFYWVAGEKQAHSFSQKNIDDNEILYAQLNMNAYQDEFSFVLSNDEMELLEKSSRIVVLAPIQTKNFITRERIITQIGLVHLNVSQIESSSPRFFVIRKPRFGRLFLRPNSNISATFFTAVDVLEGNLFFHAFRVPQRQIDEIVLELVADNVQPARLKWPIDIRPAETMNPEDDFPFPPIGEISFATVASDDEPKSSVAPPEIDYRFPILILVGMVGFVVVMALCHWRNGKEKKAAKGSSDEDSSGGGGGHAIPGIGPLRELPDLDELVGAKAVSTVSDASTSKPSSMPRSILTNSKTSEKNNLLKSTVYATIGSNNSPYGRNSSEDTANDENGHGNRVGKSKNVMLVTSRDEDSDDTSELLEHPPVKTDEEQRQQQQMQRRNEAAVSRALYASRRRTLPAVDENSTQLRICQPFGLGANGSGFGGVRAATNAAPMIAVNPVAPLKRFILPSRRPVAVSAIVPTMATFDSSQAIATHSINFRSSSTDGCDNLFSPGPTSTDNGHPLPLLPLTDSVSREQQIQLAAAAAAAAATRSTKANSSASSSDYSAPISPPQKAPQTESRLRENEYWV